jgi:cell division initiation protein
MSAWINNYVLQRRRAGMTLTPLDIQNKEFKRAFKGYDIDEVDEFLDRVSNDLEQLIRECNDYKEKVGQLQEKNKNYYKMEETMHNAIVVAQETAEEVKQSARKEAELIKKEAEREAKNIIEDARGLSGKVLAEHEELLKRARVFKVRFKSFMETQLAALDSDDWMEEQLKGQVMDRPYARPQPKAEEKPQPLRDESAKKEDDSKEPPLPRPRLELAPNREPESDPE